MGTVRPTPRKAHVAVVHGDVMYTMGGLGSNNIPLNEVMSFHFGKCVFMFLLLAVQTKRHT